MSTKLRVGFIGLGAMGLGMASCLAKAGYVVTGFDINPKAPMRLANEGGRVAKTARAAATDADVLAIMVATSTQMSTVLFGGDNGAVASLPSNSVILLCITAAPEYVFEVQERLSAVGRPDVRLVDCPVSGGEVRAWQGTLSLLCAGEKMDIDRIYDVLDCLSSQLHLIPGGIGAAMSVKMVHQILVGVHILASVEMMGLAYAAGLDLQSIYDTVMEGDASSWLFGQRATHIMCDSKVPASSLLIITKDLAMLNESGRRNQISLPLASLVHQHFIQTTSAGYDTTDDCNAIHMYLFVKVSLKSLGSRPSLSPKSNSKLGEATIADLLIGIHTAVAIEVLRFARRLGVDTAVLGDVVKDAAGPSKMFTKVCALFPGDSEVSLKHVDDVETISSNMVSALRAAEALNYPLFLSSAALQQFYSS